MIRLVISGTEVDLSGGEQIAIDYAIAKIGELGKRSGSRSIQFTLPDTAHNRLLFENIKQLTSNSKLPYRFIDARLYVDGVDQLIRVCTLSSYKGGYNVNLYDGQSDLFAKLKSKKCIDLNLNRFNHYRSFTQTVTDRSRVDGYLYPIIDYFADSPNLYMNDSFSVVWWAYLYPAMYYESMIEQMCADEGYALINKITELKDYPENGLCLPYSSVEYKRDDDVGRYNGVLYSPTNGSPPGGIGTGAWTQIALNAVIENGDYNYYVYLISLINYARFLDEINLSVKFTCTITNITGGNLNCYFAVERAAGLEPYYEIVPVAAGATINYSHDFGVLEMRNNLPTLPFFGINFTADSGVGGSIEVNDVYCTFSGAELVTLQPDINNTGGFTSYTTPASLLPNITQAELLLNYLKIFGGLTTINERTKVVTLFPFKEVAENIRRAKDWSDKIDYLIEDEVLFDLDGYTQINKLLYDDDDTVIKPTGTDGVINIEDETLEYESDLFKVSFAATEQVPRLAGQYLSQLKMLSRIGGVEPVFEQVKQRVLAVRFKDFPMDYTDGSTNVTVTTDVPLPWFIDTSETFSTDFNLGFENSLLTYYRDWIQVLDKAKILTVGVRLNAIDIEQLDFSIPVYIDRYNSWFYISEIKGYTPANTQTTQVVLVKLF